MTRKGIIRIKLPRIIACLLILSALCGVCMADTGSWSTNGPLTTGSGDKTIHALAVSPDGRTIFCGTGNGRVFSFTLSSAAVPPDTHFTSNVTAGTAPLSVQFNDTSSAASPLRWNWSLGNNNWINTTDIAQRNVSYTYNTAGDYTVSLTVTNASGSNTATVAGYIHVTAAGSGLPTASFTGTPLSGTAPLPVTFTDSSQECR